MAIERLLGEEIGPLAGKLHTGRSRNDQVATDVAMAVQVHSLQAIELAGAAMARLLELAERHRDWPMPGYTHLQRAQPVYLGHHLLAYFWMLARDVLRFQFALDSASVMPLGSGALAGVNWEIDRGAVADDLGFEHVTHNSIDGASNRDFVLDYLSAASICAMHLSRLGSEIVIWSSSEFGFCELDESFSSGSSIMPQKMNPDSAELLRAKSPRVAADYLALLGTMHALPLTYGKDMQEDKEPLFDAIDTVESCLDAAEGMLAGIDFDRERLEEASGDEMLAATEIADLLVRKGVPFREAHGIVGGLVRDAVERGIALSELSEEDLRQRSEHLDDSFYEVLRARAAGSSRSGSRAAPARRRSRRRSSWPARRSPRSRPGSPTSASERRRRRRGGHAPRALGRSSTAPSTTVARELIGCRLFYDGCGGTIVETESYERDDPACHAYVGLTERTATLFGPPARLRLPLLRHPQPARRGAAEPAPSEPTAGLEAGCCAAAASDRTPTSARARASSPTALGIGLDANNADLSATLPAPAPEPSWTRGRHRPPARDHQSRRAPLALLPRRQPVRLRAATAQAGHGGRGTSCHFCRRAALASAARRPRFVELAAGRRLLAGRDPAAAHSGAASGAASARLRFGFRRGFGRFGFGRDSTSGPIRAARSFLLRPPSSPARRAAFSLAVSAARSALISSQAEITLAQIRAGKVPPSTGPPENSVSIGVTRVGVADPDAGGDFFGRAAEPGVAVVRRWCRSCPTGFRRRCRRARRCRW